MKWLLMGMVVILPVGSLMAAALVLYTSFRLKIYMSEATVGLRTIRTMEIIHYAANGCYTSDWGELGMTSDDFARNQWFLPGCFGLTGGGTDFTAWCNGDNGKEKAKGVYLNLTSHRGVQACTLADIKAAKPTYVP